MKAIIYTKICLPCVYGEDWTLAQKWAITNKVNLKMRRTTYNPLWHELATKAYGSDKYLAFMKIGRRKIKISTMIKRLKEDDDLHELLRTSESARKNLVVGAQEESRQKAEEAE